MSTSLPSYISPMKKPTMTSKIPLSIWWTFICLVAPSFAIGTLVLTQWTFVCVGLLCHYDLLHLNLHGIKTPSSSRKSMSSTKLTPWSLALLVTSYQIVSHFKLFHLINSCMQITWGRNHYQFCHALVQTPNELHLGPFLIEGWKFCQHCLKLQGIWAHCLGLPLLDFSLFYTGSIHSCRTSKPFLQKDPKFRKVFWMSAMMFFK